MGYTDFQPSERPQWRNPEDPTTSVMLAEIELWTRRYGALSAEAKEFVCRPFCRGRVVQFVLQSNLSEGTGLLDFDSTQRVLEEVLSPVTQQQKETSQLGKALAQLEAQRQDIQQLQEAGQWDELILTPDSICAVHKTLLQGIDHRSGQLRTAHAYGGHPNGRDVFFYEEPDLLDSLLHTVCDLYNSALEGLPQDIPPAVPTLYRMASVLFHQFITVHAFSDGNGRLARILANHVLRKVTPFPITFCADGSSISRKTFLTAIMQARNAASPAFLRLVAPTDLAALMIEAGWAAWQNCFQNLDRWTPSTLPSQWAMRHEAVN